jgi:hypothetical protein
MKVYQMIIKDAEAACVTLIPGSRAFDIAGPAVVNEIDSKQCILLLHDKMSK